MSRISQEQFDQLFPDAVAWASAQEKTFVRDGVPLTPDQLDDASAAGVRSPESIRLLYAPSIPTPTNPALRDAAEAIELITPQSVALTTGYGICVRVEYIGNRRLLTHEFTHVAQFERFGSIEAFLSHYLDECVRLGYNQSPMEREAVVAAHKISL